MEQNNLNNSCSIKNDTQFAIICKNAEQGDAESQYKMGKYYEDGDGVVQNYPEAIKWYRLAVQQGHAGAQCALGRCYSQYEIANLYRKAAEQGHVEAQYRLGECYYNSYGEGNLGLKTDEYESFKWYLRAAEQGHAKAQSKVGGAYYCGDVVEKNIHEAVKWYKKAAEQGDY